MERNHEIKIRLSTEELEQLKAKVAQTNLSREEFCRKVFADAQIKSAPSDDTRMLIYEMRKIGHNINSLVAKAHITKGVDENLLRYELHNLHQLEKEIAQFYAQKR